MRTLHYFQAPASSRALASLDCLNNYAFNHLSRSGDGRNRHNLWSISPPNRVFRGGGTMIVAALRPGQFSQSRNWLRFASLKS